MDGIFLSVIVPCYDEYSRGDTGKKEDSLNYRLLTLSNYFSNFKKSYELIFVCDGCTDCTDLMIKAFIKNHNLNENWRVIIEKENAGKGKAILTGISVANGKMVLFMDADLATPLEYIDKFIKSGDIHTCIVGNRFSGKVMRKRPLSRKIITSISRVLIRPLFKYPINDTQCGFKFFPRKVVKDNIKVFSADRWMMDVELLLVMQYSGIPVKEMGIRWNNNNTSTVGKGSSFVALKELIWIYLRKPYIKYKVQKTWRGVKG